MEGNSTVERYVWAYEHGWAECVQRFAKNINFDDPSPFNYGVWVEEQAGGSAGYVAAWDRIQELIRIYGKQKVSDYLQQFKLPDEDMSSASLQQPAYEQLVESLKQTPIEGMNIGPARGVMPNGTTEQVVRDGQPIVPYSIRALDDDNLTEVIYTVFCLRELGSPKGALPAVLRLQGDLQDEKRFDFPRDRTLEMQVELFVQDCHAHLAG